MITDGSVGSGGPIGKIDKDFPIPHTLGAQVGGNLFHSFSEFNLLMGESATFTGPGDVTNVLARVTGGQASSIDGRINSTIAGANLFLINPKGIVFGKNARLSVSGSFVATSADYVALGDQGRFDATNSADDILTSAPPAAFGFLGPTPATITARGSTLIAKPGSNLGLIGGDLILRDGALVAAPSGTVQLASVRSVGELPLDISNRSATPDTSAFATLGSIGALGALDGSSLTIIQGGSAGAGGRVVIRGGRLVASRTFITAHAEHAAFGDGLDISVRDSASFSAECLVSVTSAGDLGVAPVLKLAAAGVTLNSGSSINLFTSGTSGKAGRMEIATQSLSLAGGQVNSITFGSQEGGDIAVTAGTLSLQTDSAILASSEFAGAGGAVRLDVAGSLALSGDSKIGVIAASEGAAGLLSITAGSISITGDPRLPLGESAGIVSASESNATGRGGDVSLQVSGSLILRNGGVIQARTNGSAQAGDVVISVGSISLDGSLTQIGSAVAPGATGAGGMLTVAAQESIALSDGAAILAETQGSGSGGDLAVQAASLSLAGGSSIGANTVSAVEAGRAGEVRIEIAGGVTIASQGRITRSTSGPGSGGDLFLHAASLDITGVQSGIGVETAGQTNGGAGANLFLDIDGRVEVRDGGLISATTTGSGAGGDITIDAGNLSVAGNGSGLTSQTRSASGGDIHLSLTGALSVLAGGNITSNSFGPGAGGSITIGADSVRVSQEGAGLPTGIAAQTGNSGVGGSVRIAAGDIELASGGRISVATLGAGDSGSVSLNARNMRISGAGSVVSGQTTSPLGGGRGGGLELTISEELNLADGGIITAGTSSPSARGGDLAIQARSISISGANSGIGSESLIPTAGDAGSIRITTGTLAAIGVPDAQTGVSVRTNGSGNGGSIDITADGISLEAGAAIESSTAGAGDGGRITIAAGQVALGDQASISASTAGAGHGGAISIAGMALDLDSFSSINSSARGDSGPAGDIFLDLSGRLQLGLFSDISATTAGANAGGNVIVRGTSAISLAETSFITVSTFGDGPAGSIEISGSSLDVLRRSGITSDTDGPGSAGAIVLRIAGDVTLERRAAISTSTFAAGSAGSISVAADAVNFLGSGLISSSSTGSGNAGTIEVFAERSVVLSNGGAITATVGDVARNAPELRPDITIMAPRIELRDAGSRITASTDGNGDAGSINLHAADAIHVSGGAFISASTDGSGAGGDIAITAGSALLSNPGNPETGGIFASSGSFENAGINGVGGNIRVEANRLEMLGNSILSASTYSEGVGGNITVLADRISLSGQGAPPPSGQGAAEENVGIFANSFSTLPGAGMAGQISVRAADISVREGMLISTSTSGPADAGPIVIFANRLTLDGRGSPRFTGVFAAAIPTGLSGTLRGGDGGSISVNTGQLTIFDGAGIASSTLGSGNAGDVSVIAQSAEIAHARSLQLFGGDSPPVVFAGIAASVEGGNSSGRGGNVLARIGNLKMSDGGAITARTTGRGDGGSVRVVASQLDLQSGAYISADALARGDGGDVRVEAGGIGIRGAASRISASTSPGSTGDGGLVRIDAGALRITRAGQISAETLGSGAGGNLRLTLGDAVLSSGGSISAATAGAGAGGNIEVTARSVTLRERSEISTSAIGAGRAGEITLGLSGPLTLSGNSRIATASARSDAGQIAIDTRGPVSLADSTITVQATAGNAGSISVATPKAITLRDSAIVAEAGGTGGNILLDTSFLTLDASRISANAVAGDGGLITLNIPADGILGDAEDFIIVSGFVRQSGDSRISASSQQGVQGALLIDAPELDLSNAVEGIGASLLDASNQFRETCAVHLSEDFSSFLVLGRGGVAPAPDDPQTELVVVRHQQDRDLEDR